MPVAANQEEEVKPVKLLVVLALILILGSLFGALLSLLFGRGDARRTAAALTLRVGLSFLLFALLVAAFWLGVLPV